MGFHWFSGLVLIAFCCAGVLGGNSSADSKNTGILKHSYIDSSSPVFNKSENNNSTNLEEDVIEVINSNSGTKYNKESLSRFNYTSLDRNISANNTRLLDEKHKINHLETVKVSTTNSEGEECPDSSGDFPEIFTTDDLKHGALVVVILVGIYCFTTLAIICDRYFLPCMEVLCEVLNLSQDVAAATFMSIATSTPELFVNIIGTFVTKSDLGVGTIVGSSLFNSLGVASIGSLAAVKPIQLNWWPLTRDTIIYMLAVALLITITYDNIIFWYEGLILFMIYFFYFTIMLNNHRIWNFIDKYWNKNKEAAVEDNHFHGKIEEIASVTSRKVSTISPYGSYMEDVHRHSLQNYNKNSFVLDKHFHIKEDQVSTASRRSTNSPYGSYMEDNHHVHTLKKFDKNAKEQNFNKNSHVLDKHFHIKEDQASNASRKESTSSPYGSYMEDAHHLHPGKHFDRNTSDMQIKDPEKTTETPDDEDTDSIFNFPKNAKIWRKCFWIFIFPIKFVLRYTIPDPKRHPKLFPLTFIMCIIFIGLNSYVVSWMITLTGTLFGIPDAVLGFTFLAAGGCLPESISITIMSRRGEGSMGVSNSLGANTMNILMSLGLPWFLKTITMGTNDQSFIRINSGAMEYVIMGLLLVAAILYLTLYFNKFQLRRRGGVILLGVYLVFATVSIVAEMLTSDC